MLQEAELSGQADSENDLGGSVLHRTGCTQENDQFLREDAAGHVYRESRIGATRRDLDCWVRTLPQPRMNRHGSYDLHGLDLRPPASVCGEDEKWRTR